MKKIVFIAAAWLLMGLSADAQNGNAPSALVVIAHPDDEAMCSVTIYKITKELKGTVDVAVITNGEAGFKYSTLAEAYYGVPLTDEKEGRKYLPQIRKQELMNAGKIIGVSNIFFLDQPDAKFNLDERDPLDTSWNVPLVMAHLKDIFAHHHYDFVFCMLPVPATHAGHKAASILALRTVQAMPLAERPVILGVSGSSKSDTTVRHFTQLKNYTETAVMGDTAMFHLDRTTPFGYNHALNYKMIATWEMAEHKSQGAYEMMLSRGGSDIENFWLFKINNAQAETKARQLFQQLSVVPYPTKTY